MGIAMVCAPASMGLTGDLQRAPGKLLGLSLEKLPRSLLGDFSGELPGAYSGEV